MFCARADAQAIEPLMLEVMSTTWVLTAYYRAQTHGHRSSGTWAVIMRSHAFVYARTPAGFDVEYGFTEVGPQWSVTQYSAISLWGHQSDIAAPRSGGSSS
jgi:hypothetical protein